MPYKTNFNNWRNRVILVMIFGLFLSCNNPNKKNRPNKKTEPKSQNETSISTQQRANFTGTLLSGHIALTKNQLFKLNEELDSFFQVSLANVNIKGASLHFTDLTSQQSFSINGDLKFVPASLLKLPILIAIYKMEELRPGTLKKQISHFSTLHNEKNSNLIENEFFHYQQNKIYTVEEYLAVMIRYSDNDATSSLLNFLDSIQPGFLEKVEEELQASIPNTSTNVDDIVHVHHFATFLNVLYECKYLNPSNSNKALELLNTSRYPLGFRKKLPSSLPIAHKFGVRFTENNTNSKPSIQLHQVAIIYHPKRPFLLSVMTKGSNIEDLRTVLQEAAFLTYSYLDQLPD